MNKTIKFFAAMALAAAFTGCASQQNMNEQLARKEACEASGGTLAWDQYRIKRCQHATIEDTLPSVYSVGHQSSPRTAYVMRAR